MSLCFGLACKRVAGSCTLKAFKMFLVHKIWSALKYSESVFANVPVRQWELNNRGQCSSGLACTQDYSKPLHTMTLVISVSPLWLFYSCSLILLIFTPNCPLLKVEEGGMCPVWKTGERMSEGEMRRGWEVLCGERKIKSVSGELVRPEVGWEGPLGHHSAAAGGGTLAQMSSRSVLHCISGWQGREAKGHEAKGSMNMKGRTWEGTESYKK